MNFLPRIQIIMDSFNELLNLFSKIVNQQKSIYVQQNSNIKSQELLKQMIHAQSIIEDRRKDLQAAISRKSADHFIHELWSLAGDMAHFEFDINHLEGANLFQKKSEDLSLQAMILTKELSDSTNKANFIAELSRM